MTIVSDIIRQALRESNVIAISASPTELEAAEALKKLTGLISSTLGYEVGEGLTDWPIGQAGEVDAGWNSSEWSRPPVNARLLVTSTDDETIYLPPMPDNGARLQLVDLLVVDADDPSGRTVTLDANGRLIEGAATIDITDGNANLSWLYRADLGSWKRLTTLTGADEMPFPDKFDAYFETMLAMRLNPRYGRSMDAQSMAVLQRAQAQIRAEYAQHIASMPDFALGRMTTQVDRGGIQDTPRRRGRYGWMR